MRRANPVVHDPLKLRLQFLVRVNSSPKHRRQQIAHSRRKRQARTQGITSDQHAMDTDIQPGMRLREFHGVLERGAVRH
jgi:hypothetical protein